MRILEIRETECEWLKPEDLAPALLDEAPPILLADLGEYCGGKFAGYCPNWPIFAKQGGGEIVIDSALADRRRPERTRRRLLSTALHEIAHRLTPEEIQAKQAHGAVFGAVCFALTARCLGLEDSKSHLSLYDLQDAPDKAKAFGFAVAFGERHRESGVPARDLPGLARAEWSALALEGDRSRVALEEAARRARMAESEAQRAESEAGRLRRRLNALEAEAAALAAEKAERQRRIRRIRPLAEIGFAASFLLLLALAL